MMLDPDQQKLVEHASDMKRAGSTHAQIAVETGLDLKYLSVVLRGVKRTGVGISRDALGADAINAIIKDRIAGRSRKDIAKDWLIKPGTVSLYTKHVKHLIPKPTSRALRPEKAKANAAAREKLDLAIIDRLMAAVPRNDIAAEFKVSKMKILRVIRQYGVKPPKAPRFHPLEQEILAAYDACGKPFRVAIQLGVDRNTVYRALKRRQQLVDSANVNTVVKEAA